MIDLRRLIAAAIASMAMTLPAVAQQVTKRAPHSTDGAVPVRFAEGSLHGYLELHNERGDSLLARGELLQSVTDKGMQSRMIFRFGDKSLFDETTVFTQHQIFSMVSYHLIQRGPAFGIDLDATLSSSGSWTVTTKSHDDGKVEQFDGKLDLPSDVANGLPGLIAKNLHTGDTSNVHLVAFMPKPRLVGLQIAFASTDTIQVDAHPLLATRFIVKAQLGAVVGTVAKLLGKVPADTQMWIVMDQVPSFVGVMGPFYSGPVWRLSLASPALPKVRPAK